MPYENESRSERAARQQCQAEALRLTNAGSVTATGGKDDCNVLAATMRELIVARGMTPTPAAEPEPTSLIDAIQRRMGKDPPDAA